MSQVMARALELAAQQPTLRISPRTESLSLGAVRRTRQLCPLPQLPSRANQGGGQGSVVWPPVAADGE